MSKELRRRGHCLRLPTPNPLRLTPYSQKTWNRPPKLSLNIFQNPRYNAG